MAKVTLEAGNVYLTAANGKFTTVKADGKFTARRELGGQELSIKGSVSGASLDPNTGQITCKAEAKLAHQIHLGGEDKKLVLNKGGGLRLNVVNGDLEAITFSKLRVKLSAGDGFTARGSLTGGYRGDSFDAMASLTLAKSMNFGDGALKSAIHKGTNITLAVQGTSLGEVGLNKAAFTLGIGSKFAVSGTVNGSYEDGSVNGQAALNFASQPTLNLGDYEFTFNQGGASADIADNTVKKVNLTNAGFETTVGERKYGVTLSKGVYDGESFKGQGTASPVETLTFGPMDALSLGTSSPFRFKFDGTSITEFSASGVELGLEKVFKDTAVSAKASKVGYRDKQGFFVEDAAINGFETSDGIFSLDKLGFSYDKSFIGHGSGAFSLGGLESGVTVSMDDKLDPEAKLSGTSRMSLLGATTLFELNGGQEHELFKLDLGESEGLWSGELYAFMKLGLYTGNVNLVNTLDVGPFQLNNPQIPDLDLSQGVEGEWLRADAELGLKGKGTIGNPDVLAASLFGYGTASGNLSVNVDPTIAVQLKDGELMGQVDAPVNFNGGVNLESSLDLVGRYFDGLQRVTLLEGSHSIPGLFDLKAFSMGFDFGGDQDLPGPIAADSAQADVSKKMADYESRTTKATPAGSLQKNLENLKITANMLGYGVQTFVETLKMIAVMSSLSPAAIKKWAEDDGTRWYKSILSFESWTRAAKKAGTLDWLEEVIPKDWRWVIDALRKYLYAVDTTAGAMAEVAGHEGIGTHFSEEIAYDKRYREYLTTLEHKRNQFAQRGEDSEAAHVERLKRLLRDYTMDKVDADDMERNWVALLGEHYLEVSVDDVLECRR